MGQRKCADLPQERAQLRRQKKQAQHEQDVIQTLRQDVVKAHGDIIGKGLPAGGFVAARQRNGATVAAPTDQPCIGGVHALLAQHQITGPIGPGHLHRIRALGQRRRQDNVRNPGQFDIRDLRHSDCHKAQWQRHAAHRQQRAVCPGGDQFTRSRRNLGRCQGAQRVIVRDVLRRIGVFDRVQINAGQLRFDIGTHLDDDAPFFDREVGDCGHNFVSRRQTGPKHQPKA
mmetsp:Transcript_18503/g.30269  ORF Transcript_18503/g.30269 Transcript_18503/m.30269 type:complete len:229 (+) Transcript_18503:511-1197(+)